MGAMQQMAQPLNKLHFLRLAKAKLEDRQKPPPPPEESQPSKSPTSKPQTSSSPAPENLASSAAHQAAYQHMLSRRNLGQAQQQEAMERWKKEQQLRQELKRLEEELFEAQLSGEQEHRLARLKQEIWKLKNRERPDPEEAARWELAALEAEQNPESHLPPAEWNPETAPQLSPLPQAGEVIQTQEQLAERIRQASQRERGSELHQFLESKLVPLHGREEQRVTLLYLAERLLSPRQRLEIEVMHNLSKVEQTEPAYLAELERQLLQGMRDKPENLRP